MTVNAYALSVTPEEAISPATMFSWLVSKVNAKVNHILAYTKISLDAEAAAE